MSVNLDTGAGGLFVRLGHLAYALKGANVYLGDSTASFTDGGSPAVTLHTLGKSVVDIFAGYTSADQTVIDSLITNRDATRTTLDSWKSILQTMAQNTVIQQVNDDVSLSSLDLTVAVPELIKQMIGAGSLGTPDSTIQSPTVTGSATNDSGNHGDAAVVVSVKRTDGRTAEYVLAESLTLTCTSDAQEGGGATLDQEEWSLIGEAAESDVLAWDYPQGSGTSTTLTSVDAAEDAGTNMLVNGDLESWTSNVPDSWTDVASTAGTTLFRESSTVYKGTYSMKFLGDGATNTAVTQSFGQSTTTTGTTTSLEPNTVYHFNCWIRKSASLLAGVIEVALTDTSGTVLTDDTGANVSQTIDHTTLTTTFASWGGALVTPKNLPTGTPLKLRIKATTLLTSGESVYIDNFSLVQPDTLYTDGPYVSVHSGVNPSIRDDFSTVTIANDYAGVLQDYCNRLLGLRDLGLQLPSKSSSPTIADSLVS